MRSVLEIRYQVGPHFLLSLRGSPLSDEGSRMTVGFRLGTSRTQWFCWDYYYNVCIYYYGYNKS